MLERKDHAVGQLVSRRLGLGRVARHAALAGVLGALVVVGGAVAAIDRLAVGTILPSSDVPSPPEYRQADETVLAVGTDPQIGRWRITRYRSTELRDRGEVVQPPGLPCLTLLLSDATDGRPLAGRGFCGERGSGGLSAAGLPVMDRTGHDLIVLFGGAPEAAARVELSSTDHGERAAHVEEGPASFDGDVWILVVPREPHGQSPSIDWVRADGRAAGDKVALTRELEQPGDPLPLGPPLPER